MFLYSYSNFLILNFTSLEYQAAEALSDSLLSLLIFHFTSNYSIRVLLLFMLPRVHYSIFFIEGHIPTYIFSSSHINHKVQYIAVSLSINPRIPFSKKTSDISTTHNPILMPLLFPLPPFQIPTLPLTSSVAIYLPMPTLSEATTEHTGLFLNSKKAERLEALGNCDFVPWYLHSSLRLVRELGELDSNPDRGVKGDGLQKVS